MIECQANRGPLFPGIIYRQDNWFGAMYKGRYVRHLPSYAAAEQWIYKEKEDEQRS